MVRLILNTLNSDSFFLLPFLRGCFFDELFYYRFYKDVNYSYYLDVWVLQKFSDSSYLYGSWCGYLSYQFVDSRFLFLFSNFHRSLRPPLQCMSLPFYLFYLRSNFGGFGILFTYYHKFVFFFFLTVRCKNMGRCYSFYFRLFLKKSLCFSTLWKWCSLQSPCRSLSSCYCSLPLK